MQEKLNLKSSWEQVKERLKENDISLTDEDLQYEPGKEDELFARLQKKTKKEPEDLRIYIESMSANASKAG